MVIAAGGRAAAPDRRRRGRCRRARSRVERMCPCDGRLACHEDEAELVQTPAGLFQLLGNQQHALLKRLGEASVVAGFS
eukprot:3161076-Pleurochrysis_carterae.AAC.1